MGILNAKKMNFFVSIEGHQPIPITNNNINLLTSSALPLLKRSDFNPLSEDSKLNVQTKVESSNASVIEKLSTVTQLQDQHVTPLSEDSKLNVQTKVESSNPSVIEELSPVTQLQDQQTAVLSADMSTTADRSDFSKFFLSLTGLIIISVIVAAVIHFNSYKEDDSVEL